MVTGYKYQQISRSDNSTPTENDVYSYFPEGTFSPHQRSRCFKRVRWKTFALSCVILFLPAILLSYFCLGSSVCCLCGESNGRYSFFNRQTFRNDNNFSSSEFSNSDNKNFNNFISSHIRLKRNRSSSFKWANKTLDRTNVTDGFRKRLPQAVIIGVRKGGTRPLLAFLNMHPKVVVAPKEIHFYDRVENWTMGVDWYIDHMPLSYENQITVEKTPGYFASPEAPQRMYETYRKRKLLHTLKLLLIVRNPIDRAVSDWLQIYLKNRSDPKPNPKMLSRFENLAFDYENDRVRNGYSAIVRSIYSRHIKRWFKYFDSTQIWIVNGEKLVSNPVQEIRQIESFLSLEHRVGPEKFIFNETKGFFCMRKTELHTRCLGPKKGRPHPRVDTYVWQRLIEFFRPKNAKFFSMVQRQFPSWDQLPDSSKLRDTSIPSLWSDDDGYNTPPFSEEVDDDKTSGDLDQGKTT